MEAIKDLKIDGVSFVLEWAWAKTETEFVNEFKDMDHIYPDAQNKVSKLKEAYALIQKQKPKELTPVKPAAGSEEVK